MPEDINELVKDGLAAVLAITQEELLGYSQSQGDQLAKRERTTSEAKPKIEELNKNINKLTAFQNSIGMMLDYNETTEDDLRLDISNHMGADFKISPALEKAIKANFGPLPLSLNPFVTKDSRRNATRNKLAELLKNEIGSLISKKTEERNQLENSMKHSSFSASRNSKTVIDAKNNTALKFRDSMLANLYLEEFSVKDISSLIDKVMQNSYQNEHEGSIQKTKLGHPLVKALIEAKIAELQAEYQKTHVSPKPKEDFVALAFVHGEVRELMDQLRINLDQIASYCKENYTKPNSPVTPRFNREREQPVFDGANKQRALNNSAPPSDTPSAPPSDTPSAPPPTLRG